jgi:saccharopine dehydrogenase-like NADP-dependent oxidoreductase
MKRLNLLSYEKINLEGLTYAAFLTKQIGEKDSRNIRDKVASWLNISVESSPMIALEWLGLFSEEPVNRLEDSPFEIVSDLMIARMMIQPEERDMVVMLHTFIAGYPDGTNEVIKSRMLDFGTLLTDTSVARTVALPAACGVEMILEGRIRAKGVHIPVVPEIYNPILDSLEKMNIRMEEEYGLPLSEGISMEK